MQKQETKGQGPAGTLKGQQLEPYGLDRKKQLESYKRSKALRERLDFSLLPEGQEEGGYIMAAQPRRIYQIERHTAQADTRRDGSRASYDMINKIHCRTGNDDFEVVAEFETLEQAKTAFASWEYRADYTPAIPGKIYNITYYELTFKDLDEDGDDITPDTVDRLIDSSSLDFFLLDGILEVLDGYQPPQED